MKFLPTWCILTALAVLLTIGDGVNGAEGVILGCVYGLAAGITASLITEAKR